MSNSVSITRRLTTGFAWIGITAASVLLIFVAFDYDQLFDSNYRTLGVAGRAFEIADHVVIPLIVLLLPVIAATPWVIRRALKPLEIAAQRIDGVSGMDRGFRVDLTGLPNEAVPFASAVNNLLERLDIAAERQEGFAADVAHELKTPLAIIALELDRSKDPETARIKQDIASMNRLIDQLLLLAQLDADAAARVPFERVRLQDIAIEVTSRLAPIAVKQGKSIAFEAVTDPYVWGRREALASALRNLVENALRVSPDEVPVVTLVGPGPMLRVRDGGPGITQEQLEIYSRRLQRADNASVQGAGLGMEIVSRIMSMHEGKLETEPELREVRLNFIGGLRLANLDERLADGTVQQQSAPGTQTEPFRGIAAVRARPSVA